MPTPSIVFLSGLLLLCACHSGHGATREPQTTAPQAPAQSLIERRASFRTSLHAPPKDRFSAPKPPVGDLELVAYHATLGENVAYVTPVREGPKRPAILWIQGGFNWSIDESTWKARPWANDQSARVFRDAGIAMMYAAPRGSNQNAGDYEGFLGEVADFQAAAEFLAHRPDVDPARIYLGGHSTGGTMALLVAEGSHRFRAVFAFGPVGDMRHYDEAWLPDGAERVQDDEVLLRSPMYFLDELNAPTFIVEGAEDGNAGVIPSIMKRAGASRVNAIVVEGASHFSVLRPVSGLIAEKILADTGPVTNISLTEAEAVSAFRKKPPVAQQEE